MWVLDVIGMICSIIAMLGFCWWLRGVNRSVKELLRRFDEDRFKM